MTTLLEEYAALALDKQTTLERLTDTAAAWFVDQNIGQLTLGDEHFTIHWLGTYSHHSGSWLWAWVNPHLTMTANDAASADILRAYIAPNAAAEGDDSTNLFQNPADTALLTQESFKLDVTELHNLAAVVCGLTGADAYYLGDYGDDIALLAIHDLRVAAAWREDDSPARILSIIPQTINYLTSTTKTPYAPTSPPKATSSTKTHSTSMPRAPTARLPPPSMTCSA